MKKVKRFFLYSMACILLGIFFSVNAAITQKTATATAYGKTYQSALQQALIQSVAQSKGVSVGSIYETFEAVSHTKGFIDVDGVKMPVKSYLSSEGFISKIRSATKGVIDHFSVTNAVKKDDLWSVTVKVTYSEYQTLASKAQQQKPTLAVLPFLFSPGSINGQFNPDQLQITLYQNIQTNMIQSKAFRIMDRSQKDQAAYENEMRLILSDRASNAQKARFSQQIGADYLLLGSVQNITYQKVQKQFYGSDFSQWKVSLTINYRLIETATMQVINAQTIHEVLPSSEVVRMLQDDMTTKQDVINLLLQKASNQLSGQVLANFTSSQK
ncbi:CsgG/HfaB family protein [Facilibium subflavum]|uniref:CsgG/HfaB family protein n=1 Tax=Facilibium subflavum TaxID=2219058 RepID=UPI000E648B1E|nr:CsgG/HfaB family protein [Facilibium subflavum]